MPPSTLAFFGATGDCAGYCLSSALSAGHHCVALARTPSKLTKSMKSKGVSEKILEDQLTIVQGNVKDPEAVKKALVVNGKIVDIVVCGIGPTPDMMRLNFSILNPVSQSDPTLCTTANATILSALNSLINNTKTSESRKKPLLISVSTTGIPSPGSPNDVPYLLWPLYKWLLQAPHHDKQGMEANIRAQISQPESERAISDYVTVKPTLLMSGPGKGVKKVNAGPEERPAFGYAIQRADVGRWMYESLVENDVKKEWLNKSVSLAYL